MKAGGIEPQLAETIDGVVAAIKLRRELF